MFINIATCFDHNFGHYQAFSGYKVYTLYAHQCAVFRKMFNCGGRKLCLQHFEAICRLYERKSSEINEQCKNNTVIYTGHLKSGTIRWAGHVAEMWSQGMHAEFRWRNLLGHGQLWDRRITLRWIPESQVFDDLRWMKLIFDRVGCRALLLTVLNFIVVPMQG
jgi:hypothetical protein